MSLVLIPAHAWADTSVPAAGAMEFPHAGISVHLPGGFVLAQPDAPSSILRATRKTEPAGSQLLTLSAFSIGKGVSAEKFAELMLKKLRARRGIANLKVVSRTPMAIGGLQGHSRLLDCTRAGRQVAIADVCLVRKMSNGHGLIGYMLTLESPGPRSAGLLSLFGKIVKSVSLTAVRTPINTPVGPLGEPVVHAQGGYSLRGPLNWYVSMTPKGLVAGQSNYFHGGEVRPFLGVVAMDVKPGTTCEDYAAQQLTRALARARKAGFKASVLSQSELTLAGREARQFVILQEPASATTKRAIATAATKPADVPHCESTLLVLRTFCAMTPDGQNRSYTLGLLCNGCETDASKAAAFMDRIAEGFKLLTPAKLAAKSDRAFHD